MTASRYLMQRLRRVLFDSKENTSDEEHQRRLDHAYAEDAPVQRSAKRLCGSGEPNVRFLSAEYVMPERPELFCAAEERKLRAADPTLDQVCAQVQAELLSRHPNAVDADGGFVIYDFLGERALRDQWNAAHDAAAVRADAKLQPLKVKDGDFVRIDGRVVQVQQVDLRRRTVTTRRLDADGSVRSTVDGVRADGLEPLPERPPVELDGWPPIPAHLTDGLARARAVLRMHVNHLIAAGLIDE